MENEPPQYHKFLSTSDQMQRSTQAILMEKADGTLECVYTGEGTPTDAWFIPAIMDNKVQKGNVYMMSHPDDYSSGMYDQLKGEPQ